MDEVIKHFPILPSIQGQTDLQEELRALRSNQYTLLEEINQLKGSQQKPPSSTDAVATVRSALLSTGSKPLNVQNLPGTLSQPQLAGVPQVFQLPGTGPFNQIGVIVALPVAGGQLALFRWSGTAWVQVAAPVSNPWQDWTPTFSSQGGMTVSGVSIQVARYVLEGKKCSFLMHASMTLGGVASNVVFFTPPAVMAAPSVTGGVFVCQLNNPGGVGQIGQAAGATVTQQIGVNQSDTNNPFALGANSIEVSGFYEIA